MTPDRFDEIERVCQAALDRPPETRAAFLDEVCKGDPDLRTQVEALLAGASRAASLMEEPAFIDTAPTLTAGQRLGPYEVLSLIGEGGMGQVYKARDTRLDRAVAIKILPPSVAADPLRRARFEREAKTIAGLTHPRICALYDVVEHDGSMCLVMEHLVGETLAARLAKGRIPLDQVLTVATEIADALAAAHRHGIVHRDLKPGNVMLTKAGTKLLDFGLAKLKKSGEPAAPFASTQMASLTAEGTIAGTLQYMAPEQLEGKEADPRSDIFAFGAVLYEMLTGRRAFQGDNQASIISAIMSSHPPAVSSLQPLTPPALDRLAGKCLAKDPEARWQNAADLADALRWNAEAADRSASGIGLLTTAGVRPRRRVLALAAAVLVLAAVVPSAVVWWLRPAPRIPMFPPVRFLMDVRPAEELNAGGVMLTVYPASNPGGSGTALTWTPDGQALVFVGRRGGIQRLYVRRLDSLEAKPLDDSVGAQVPVVSADGRWIAFWADGAIKKAPLSAGSTETWVDGITQPPIGMAWSEAGLLIGPYEQEGLHERTGTRSVSIVTSGSAPKPVTVVQQGEASHILPHWLPGGRAFLYTARRRALSWSDDQVFAHDVATGARTKLLSDAVDARYVGGYLVFLRRGLLMAIAFDADRLQATGEPFALVNHVVQGLTTMTGAGQYSIAPTGNLAYLEGQQAGWPDARIVTVNRRGDVVPLATPVKSYGMNVRLDPHGSRIANSVYTLTGREIWVYDLEHGGMVARLGLGGEVSANRSWTPDGKRLTFGWVKPDGLREIVWQAVDGSARPEKLAEVGEPGGWTPDGKSLLGVRDHDIWLLASAGGARPIVQSAADEWGPALSPDARWLAYASDTSGRPEVFVQSFPGPGERQMVSTDGGNNPLWHPRGGELFFLRPPDGAGRSQMMVASQDPQSGRLGSPRPLFRFLLSDLRFYSTPFPGYDVALDGQRFFVTQTVPSPPQPPVTQVNIVLNWFEELKAKAPATR